MNSNNDVMLVVICLAVWAVVGCALALAFYARELWLYENNDTSYAGEWWTLGNLGGVFAGFWPFFCIALLPGLFYLGSFLVVVIKNTTQSTIKRMAARKKAAAAEARLNEQLREQTRYNKPQGPHR